MDKSTFLNHLRAKEDPHTLIMGIVNVTPDSFSDGGEFFAAEDAITQGIRLVNEGADLIDIGGESSRPGAKPIGTEEELRRVIPVIRGIRKALPSVVISLDTYRSEVAQAGLDEGVTMINDISAGRFDPEILNVAARNEAPICLMHMQKDPETMQENPTYENVVHEVKEALLERAHAALAAGCSPSQIVLDPGIGFGKTVHHNLQLIAGIRSFTELPYPILLGVSRKSFLSKLPGQLPSATPDSPKARDLLTASISGLVSMMGVTILRVHNVKASLETLTLTKALREASPTSEISPM